LMKALVKSGDYKEAENLIKNGRMSDEFESILISGGPQFRFARMLLLSRTHQHKEALNLEPDRGHDYIVHVSKSDSSICLKLHLALIAIYFERNDHSKAVEVIEKNEELFLTTDGGASGLIELIPSNFVLTGKFVAFLKKLNNSLSSRKRSSIVDENMNSYAFLNTYTEWSRTRQTGAVTIQESSACTVCNQQLITDGRLSAVAILPNSTVAHPSCIDPSASHRRPQVIG